MSSDATLCTWPQGKHGSIWPLRQLRHCGYCHGGLIGVACVTLGSSGYAKWRAAMRGTRHCATGVVSKKTSRAECTFGHCVAQTANQKVYGDCFVRYRDCFVRYRSGARKASHGVCDMHCQVAETSQSTLFNLSRLEGVELRSSQRRILQTRKRNRCHHICYTTRR